MARNIDDGQSASGQAAQAMADVSTWASYYEDRAAAGGAGVPIVAAGAVSTPVDVAGPEVVTGVHQ
jgi:hypothetical protein